MQPCEYLGAVLRCRCAGSLKERYDQYSITYRDVLSAALYPKVFDEFKCAPRRYYSADPRQRARSGFALMTKPLQSRKNRMHVTFAECIQAA